MCGLAGVIAGSKPVDLEVLRAMNDAMRSRGPDGEGVWLERDARAGLAHRRLSIIDLSDAGSQPMVRGRNCISYNGEIYNYRELREGLEAQGRRFVSQSDTEVLLHLYEEYGTEMFAKIRGMYAFVLWDGAKGKALIARDPYGVKPLYYAAVDGGVRLASQVKALMAAGDVSRQKSLAGMAGFYLLGSVPEPYTIFEKVHALPAGSFAWVGTDGLESLQAHFSVADQFNLGDAQGAQELTGADMQERVREALRESVRHHLVADVPVGVFLSAGIDSGAMLALMRELGQQEVQAVTLAFESFRGGHHDEAPWAQRIAERYGAKHVVRRIRAAEMESWRDQIVEAMDQPSVDGTNTWLVSRAAAEMGLKVALSGLGGDELVGGYTSFRDIPRWVGLFGLPGRIPHFGRAVRELYRRLLQQHLRLSPKAAGMVEYGGSYSGAYLLRRGIFMPWELGQVMGEEQARQGLMELQPLRLIEAAMASKSTDFGRVASLEAGLYMKNQLLRDCDWASMSHSLEVRVPLVDAWLLKSLGSLFARYGRGGGKRFVAQSPKKPLPDQLRVATKTGFSIPMAAWLDHDERFSAWRQVKTLSAANCHWARRFSYGLMQTVN